MARTHQLTPLDHVKRATKRRADAHEAWVEAILHARAEGETLRAIGDAAGVSNVWVLQLVRTHADA